MKPTHINWQAIKKQLHRCENKGCWRYAILKIDGKPVCSQCFARWLEKKDTRK